ncbi:hypothetical protein [Microbacterium aurantiacum]|uniref:hypothetical protein n=1 Tax=Microbacterium aurantiacum TaxID=162393 RepID=UPI00342F6475
MRPVVRAVLVLLLAVTAWSASHGDTRGTADSHPVAAISSVATTDAQAAGEDAPARHPAALPAQSDAGTDAGHLAACFFAVWAGAALIALARLAAPSRRRQLLTAPTSPTPVQAAPARWSRRSALTLTQLDLPNLTAAAGAVLSGVHPPRWFASVPGDVFGDLP